jgi:molecular chaperone GrpE
MKAGWQRTQADFDNYRKRMTEEVQKRETNGQLRVTLDLLPVFDNFDRAYKHIPDEDKEKKWVQGVIAIEKQFHSILSNLGVEKYHVTGKKFDPEIAEAVFSEKSDKPEDTILEELEPGYKMGEKIIRYARVKVSKGKEKGA